MRSRELRLGRSLRGIVMSVLTSPLAGAVACHAAAGSVDTSTGQTSNTDGGGGQDAGAEDAGDATLANNGDATTEGGGGVSTVPNGGWDLDGSCALVSLPDGTANEGTFDGCAAYALAPCGLPATAQFSGCVLDLATCITPCKGGFFLYCQLASVSCDDAGNVLDAATVVECISCGGITGRRPLGLGPPKAGSSPIRSGQLGAYFASMAHLESASIRAFRDLARWLAEHGAPARLTRLAERSAADERRHTRAASRLARRFGSVPLRPRIRSVPTPTLVALLKDDAIEGCVNETFGALLATWQAARASDQRIRRTLSRIAADETRHAALAWDILAWGMTRLDETDRAIVEGAIARALATLQARATTDLDPAVRDILGYPSAADEGRLARELARAVMRQRPSPGAAFGYEIPHEVRPSPSRASLGIRSDGRRRLRPRVRVQLERHGRRDDRPRRRH